jgi:hypothetical protein
VVARQPAERIAAAVTAIPVANEERRLNGRQAATLKVRYRNQYDHY